MEQTVVDQGKSIFNRFLEEVLRQHQADPKGRLIEVPAGSKLPCGCRVKEGKRTFIFINDAGQVEHRRCGKVIKPWPVNESISGTDDAVAV